MTDETHTTNRASMSDAPQVRDTEPAVGDRAADALLRAPRLPLTTGASQVSACLAYRIGAQIGRMTAQHHAADASGKAPTKDDEYSRGIVMRRATAASDLLQDAMTYVTAQSLPGALAQLVVGAQLVLRGIETPEEPEEQKQLLRAALRCLYGATGVLAQASGVSPRCFGSDYLMPRHLDALARAWDRDLEASTYDRGPKPTVDDARDDALVTVEHRLVEHNRIAAEWWAIYEDSGRVQGEGESSGNVAQQRMGEQAAAHAMRRQRENLIRAINLPATTAREFGLQARLVALELNEWWDDNKQPDGEIACRALLDRLMACAGVTHIQNTGDVAPEEVRSWLSEPEAHVLRYNPDMREDRR